MSFFEAKKHNQAMRRMMARNHKRLGLLTSTKVQFTISAKIIEPDEQETGICNSCGEELEPVMENNGFTEPQGPSHWEVAGYKLCMCRRENI